MIYRGSPETDEEGNEIPLPERQTSIDPQQDPDYSSWGIEPAPVNYIGLIAYLVNAGTELHERVKALESKWEPTNKILLLLLLLFIHSFDFLDTRINNRRRIYKIRMW